MFKPTAGYSHMNSPRLSVSAVAFSAVVSDVADCPHFCYH